MSRAVTIGLASALVLTNAFWLYRGVDGSVTIDHQASEVKRQRERVDLLRALLVDYPRDLDAAPAYDQLRARYPDRVVKLRGDTIEMGEMQFRHGDGGLRQVTPF